MAGQVKKMPSRKPPWDTDKVVEDYQTDTRIFAIGI
jgi:hypothetical protein